MKKTKKISPETKAKHVFGELTLADVIPLVRSKCQSVITVDEDGDELVWSNFTMQEDVGLNLWESFDENDPSVSFDAETKVKVKEDHIELETGEEIYFAVLKPLKIEIL